MAYKCLAELLTGEEMIFWKGQIEGKLETALKKGVGATSVFTAPDTGAKHWEVFRTRIGEHVSFLASFLSPSEGGRMGCRTSG